jgi:hypothetical protein
MYTMNRCLSPLLLQPRCSQLASPQNAAKNVTKKVAACASIYWAEALFTALIWALQPGAAMAQSDTALAVAEPVASPGAFVGRQFPPNAQRGKLQVVQGAEILIDGKPERLSPGARIRGPQNGLVMSGSLAGQELVVNFVRDAYNNVHQIWLLTALEASQKIKPATPANNVLFESEGQKAKVDDGKTPFDQLPKYKQ